MKPTKSTYIAVFCALLGFFPGKITATPVGTAFNYQGCLTAGTNAANGVYDFSFALFDDPSTGAQKGPTVTSTGTPVSNGVFTAMLDFGNVFDGGARWLAVWVRTNGPGSYTQLTPRQPLTPTPYAVFASSLSSNVNQTFTGTVSFGPSSGPPFTVNSSTKVVNLNADLLDGLDSTAFWKLGGNVGTASAVNFVGTVDNQPLELKVNGQRALRLEPTSTAPNFIAGSSNNYVTSVSSPSEGSAIGGGLSNSIWASFNTIGGGENNSIYEQSVNSTIGGGSGNTVSDLNGTIGGGQSNVIDYGGYATISGGQLNRVGIGVTWANGAAIGGGMSNLIANGTYHTVAGGLNNRVDRELGADPGLSGGTISGGRFNSLTADGSTISGGQSNFVRSTFGAIGGGSANLIATIAASSTISGGNANSIETNAAYATVSGGHANGVRYGVAYQTTPTNSTVGGGFSNQVYTADSVIGGGRQNTMGSTSSRAYESGHTIAGGVANAIKLESAYSTIAGGMSNVVDAQLSTISGGASNQVFWAGARAGHTIGGGAGNGIGGGLVGYSVIAGGYSNSITYDYAAIGGGLSNRATGISSCVPGGDHNTATHYAFAAGHRAQATSAGSFVWADATDADFTSTAANQFLIRASGGVGINTATPGAMLDVRGDVKMGGSGQYYAAGGGENLRIVRGIVQPDGSIYNGTGFTVTHGSTGHYSITFNPPFADAPALILTPYSGASPTSANCNNGTASGYSTIVTWSGSSQADLWWNFVAIGAR